MFTLRQLISYAIVFVILFHFVPHPYKYPLVTIHLIHVAYWLVLTYMNPADEGTRLRAHRARILASYGAVPYASIPNQDPHHVCLICRGPYRNDQMVVMLPCQHAYHKKCLENSFLDDNADITIPMMCGWGYCPELQMANQPLDYTQIQIKFDACKTLNFCKEDTDEPAPGAAAVNRRLSPEKSRLEVRATGSVFRLPCRRPMSDHCATITIRFVSTPALISDYCRPPSWLR
ncbi:43kDa postsynaptic protein [Parasponia andersonii]|uniref:43kDa postsynaptic protein n=1 Tax=Parasponia andersonii TaxID=3476 RepID=A0A2P5BC37_PARAD|nr:43kDa postsynaptic protein [Parasponia andersonii]